MKSSLFLFQIINCQAMNDYIGSSQFLALQQISQFQLFNLDLVIGYSISFILLFNLNSFILNGPINSLFIWDFFAKGLAYLILFRIFLSPRSSLDHPSWVTTYHWIIWTGDHQSYSVLQYSGTCGILHQSDHLPDP